MPKLKIEKLLGSYDYEDEIREVNVYLDDKLIGNGTFGGEPEDNCESRDYYWVIPMIKSLGEKLGAHVSTTETKEE